MSAMDKNGPAAKFGSMATQIRDPRDSKQKRGIFYNWPRYLKLGGYGLEKALPLKPGANRVGGGPDAVGIGYDRGKGRR